MPFPLFSHAHTPVRPTLTIAALGAALLLGGCTASETVPPTTSLTQETSTHSASDLLTIESAWVKAGTQGTMTGLFLSLTNTGDTALTLTSAHSDSATMMELHDTVAADDGSTTMVEVDGGFTIAPGDTMILEPGGRHLMLMGLTNDLIAGDTLDVTLTFDDGSSTTINAPIREVDGAQETYEHQETDMGGHDN